MKILVISNFYPPYVWGGYELYARDIVIGLKKLGHEVHVLTSQTSHLFAHENISLHDESAGQIYARFPLKIDNFYRTNQVNIFKKASRFLFNPQNFLITRDIISKINPDIISIWNLRLLSIAPLVASTMSKRPVILHIYDPWLLPVKIFKPFPWIRDSLVNLNHFITCTRSLARKYEAVGIKKDSITIFPHGVDAYPKRRERISSPNGKRLLIVSSLSKEKGVDIALRALSILINKRNRTNIILNIYGDGDTSYRRDLESIVKREGIESHVNFKGWIEPEKLDEVFCQHDIFISPERWATLPLVLLQAMASELAVIGMDFRGMDEVIKDGANGLLVPPDSPEHLAKAIDRLDRDSSLRRNLGLKARETIVEKFDIEQDIKNIEKYYFDVIKK